MKSTTTVKILCLLNLILFINGGRAPSVIPKLPENFCPKETGVATATTGECMCNWQHRDGCKGSGCKYEMGLSWYHYTCKDCKCMAEPKMNE
mmetsp:Transcript_6123/g.7767  ORF Transcript_6123/g.7767 Transcript_6123/m.7767 type:complete len:92 (+) Transcript_6123:20-295(+)